MVSDEFATFSLHSSGQEEWNGSSIDVECHNGRIKISYADEFDEQVGKAGFLQKFFGVRF